MKQNFILKSKHLNNFIKNIKVYFNIDMDFLYILPVFEL